HLIDADARLKSTHDRGCGVIGTDHELTAWYWRKLIVKGDPKFFGKWKFKIWWHHADDSRSLAINPNALSDNVGFAVEILLPNFVAQNGDFLCARLVVVGGGVTAHDRLSAVTLEEILGDRGACARTRLIC